MSPQNRPEQRSAPETASSSAPGADRGISLIELVMAMALFALVAVMGAQALTGMIRMRDSLTTRSSQSAALAEVTSLLRADLSALVPMLFYPPNRARPEAALRLERRATGVVLSLSRGGMPRFDAGLNSVPQNDLQTGRIEWQLHNGQLIRSFWPSLIPASPRSRRQTGTDFAAPLGGINTLRLRSYWPQIGWIDGLEAGRVQPRSILGGTGDDDSAGGASEVYSDSLPLAVELTLVTGHFGEISLIESLK